jgi:glycosyltransferase involved in cell wall biosynthesis
MKIVISGYDDVKNPYFAGGGAIAIHQVAKRLAERHQVTVLTGKYPGCKDLEVDGVNYKRVGLSFAGPQLGQLCFSLMLPFYVMSLSHDVWIESFTPPFSTNFLQLFTSRPVIGLVHMLSGKFMRERYKLPFDWIEKLGLKTYRRFIVLSKISKRAIRASNKTATIEIIPNGVNMPVINRRTKKTHIGYIGRVDMNLKGLDLLLKAFALIKDKTALNLVIAGSGEPRELKRLYKAVSSLGLKDRVQLVGYVDGKAKDDFFQKSAFCVMPSRYETFALVGLEAMSYNIPMVMFDIEGLRWIPKTCGLKATPFKYRSLATIMLKLSHNAKLRADMSAQSKVFIKDFSWDKVALLHEELIVSAVNEQVIAVQEQAYAK